MSRRPLREGEQTEVVTVRVPSSVLARLKAKAKKRGITLAELIRRAIEWQLP